MRTILILGILLFGISVPGFVVAERSNPAMNNILQGGQKVRISNRQAAERIKRNYPASKILSVKLIESGGPPVYRIKTLSDDGVVKLVFVDGLNGKIFE